MVALENEVKALKEKLRIKQKPVESSRENSKSARSKNYQGQ